ncbi:Golgi-specific brefeldin A-resistance guanine nucleotide exchange factor 1-like [Lineus longissimus]|uniref:Golgi-specific brefeldin A-resistance guanine nucleotide exchange factor 1-like n=1 Tax=Lineus longissimus TaxID=88925 RepID=UPI002B4F5634
MAMMPPKNGIYIVQGEINLVVTAMRRSSRWSTQRHQDDEQDPLLSSFSQLKDILTNITDLDEIEPNVFLGPFLDVIRSEDTTGPVTGLALSSVNKFLSYGLVDPGCDTAAAAIENIADAVTHARFVGTDPGSDEVVLMKILHVLRTLLLTPAGTKLTNESVCEIMQSCFRICFEMRLSELLRKSAEHTLMDMVQLLFTRLPQFKEDTKWIQNLTKKLKMRASGMDPTRGSKKKRSPKPRQRKMPQSVVQTSGLQAPHTTGIPEERQSDLSASDERTDSMEIERADVPAALQERVEGGTDDQSGAPGDQTVGRDGENADADQSLQSVDEYPDMPCVTIATTPVAPSTTVVDIHESFQERYEEERDEQDRNEDAKSELTESTEMTPAGSMLSVPGDMDSKKSGSETELDTLSCPSEVGDDHDSVISAAETSDAASVHEAEFVGPRGVRFTPQQFKEGFGPMIPYGLPCVRELFRFLISLTNPLDRHNNDVMIHMGLSLLTVALESGADNIGQFNSLIGLVKDDMCKNLFSLLQSERLSLFSASLRVCFLLFESTRSHLKLQLEMYLTKLMDIIISESPRISYEQREIALESVVQLWRIPGLVTELYLNYDCDIYCSNLFEDLTKLLSKNAFPVSGLYTTHLLSLDSLLTVIDSIEQHCHSRILNGTKLTDSESKASVKFADQDGEVKPDEEESPSRDCESVPPVPALSGYSVGQNIPAVNKDQETEPTKIKMKDGKRGPVIKPNRMKVTSRLPSEEELAAIKRKKKLLHTGTEQFNIKPSKGIAFLQEHGLMSTPLDPGEVVTFLKENPRLDKKMIGEFISSKKNAVVLEAFVKSFIFDDLRVDEALRLYLEQFRLPGEAPVISYLLEHFAEHWHKTNGEPFVNADAAFTLAYAVIMLNVDQHNHNVKKQSVPMTIYEFRKNLKGVNGGANFEEEMLEEIYAAIKSDEIVMPAEQVGQVRENYLWKVLLRRGTGREGLFSHAPTGSFDHDLFSLIWGPTVAALSFVFDKSLDDTIVQKAISGFRKCAMISAHYGLSDVFDNLVISLCKFTTLLSAPESPENIPILFGNNQKAQLAARTVFGLAHRHGDILREGWKNILDCLLQLYRAKLLPKVLVEVEDFLDPNGKVSLIKEDVGANQRQDSGVLSSFYSYFALSDNTQQRGPTPDEQEAIKISHTCIRDCHIEQLILDTKFLRMDSLQELTKALLFAAQCHLNHDNIGTHYDEDASVFYLEQLIRVVLQNRDRVAPIWQSVRDYFYNILVNATEPSFMVERAVVGLLRLAIRLLRREDIAPQVLTTLRIFLMMKPAVIHSVCRQVSFGLHELLRTNAANIHSAMDWYTLFTLLEVVGAGCSPPPMSGDGEVQEVASDGGAQSDSELPSTASEGAGEKGYTSDSELYEARTTRSRSTPDLDVQPAPGGGSWLLVNKNKFEDKPVNQFNIVLNEEIRHHDTKSLLKSCETLAFLVRDAAHVTPHNFQSCVHCIRTFVEAGLNGGVPVRQPKQHNPKEKKRRSTMKRSRSSPSHLVNQTSDDETEGESTTGGYHSLSIQLLDLMHTLHTRTASIFSSWAEEEKAANGENIDAGAGTLWVQCWCPLLQGIARLCCDTRRQVRSQALTYLQRALLVHDLQTLSAMEWESCFNKVLFPLLSKLLDNINPQDQSGLEETRMRAATLLCKVFLQHLTPLLSLSTFTALWLTILEFMDKYMHADKSDLLYEAIPESLKNMLLVMDTAGIFELTETEESQLWKLTWDKIDTFLPNLREEVFKPHNKHEKDRGRRSQPPPQGDAPPSTQPVPSEPPVTTATTTQPVSQEPVESDNRPSSPLTSATVPKSSGYILHPPLPDTSSTSKIEPTMPILLNPDVMQHTAIPIISPQGTPERVSSPSVVAESR